MKLDYRVKFLLLVGLMLLLVIIPGVACSESGDAWDEVETTVNDYGVGQPGDALGIGNALEVLTDHATGQ